VGRASSALPWNDAIANLAWLYTRLALGPEGRVALPFSIGANLAGALNWIEP
jgi:hypothetical protein